MQTLTTAHPAPLEAESSVAHALGLPQHPSINEAALASRVIDLERRLQFALSNIANQLPSVRHAADAQLDHQRAGNPYSYMVPYGKPGMNAHYLTGMGPGIQQRLTNATNDKQRREVLELLPQVNPNRGDTDWYAFTRQLEQAVVGRLRELDTTLVPGLFTNPAHKGQYWRDQLKAQTTYQSALDRKQVMRKFKFWGDELPNFDKALSFRGTTITHNAGQTYFLWTMDDPVQPHRQWALVFKIDERPNQLEFVFERRMPDVPPSFSHHTSVEVWTRDSIEQVWMTAENIAQLNIVPTEAFLARVESDFAEFDEACAAVIGADFPTTSAGFAELLYEALESNLPFLADDESGEYKIEELSLERTPWTYTLKICTGPVYPDRMTCRSYSVSMRIDQMGSNSGGTLGILYLDKHFGETKFDYMIHRNEAELRRWITFGEWYENLSDRERAALKNYVVDVLVPRLQSQVAT